MSFSLAKSGLDRSGQRCAQKVRDIEQGHEGSELRGRDRRPAEANEQSEYRNLQEGCQRGFSQKQRADDRSIGPEVFREAIGACQGWSARPNARPRWFAGSPKSHRASGSMVECCCRRWYRYISRIRARRSSDDVRRITDILNRCGKRYTLFSERRGRCVGRRRSCSAHVAASTCDGLRFHGKCCIFGRPARRETV